MIPRYTARETERGRERGRERERKRGSEGREREEFIDKQQVTERGGGQCCDTDIRKQLEKEREKECVCVRERIH